MHRCCLRLFVNPFDSFKLKSVLYLYCSTERISHVWAPPWIVSEEAQRFVFVWRGIVAKKLVNQNEDSDGATILAVQSMCYLRNLFKITIFSKFLKEESEIWIQKDFGHMARRRGNKKGHNIIIIATPCNPSLPLPTPPPLAALSPLPVKHTLSLVYHGNHSICPKQTQRHSCTEIKTTCLIKGSTIVDSVWS